VGVHPTGQVKMCKVRMVIVFLSLAPAAVTMGGPLTGDKVMFPPTSYLVRARAVAVGGKLGLIHCTFKIEQVYVGDASLVGKTFEAADRHTVSGLDIPHWWDPEVRHGEVGIWWVVERRGRRVQFLERPGPLVAAVCCVGLSEGEREGFFAPARKGIASEGCLPYEEAEKCARAMERVYRAGPRARIDILKGYCRLKDDIFLIRWSQEKLSRVLPEADYAAFLKELVDEDSLPLFSELYVDSWLRNLDPTWETSAQRLHFLERWMCGDLGKEKNDLEQSISAQLFGGDFGPLPYPTVLRLVVDALSSRRRSDQFKGAMQAAARAFRPKDAAEAAAGFDYVLGEARQAPSPTRRAAAARLLAIFVPLRAAQVEAVEAVRRRSAAGKVASGLDKVVEQTRQLWENFSGEDISAAQEVRRLLKALPAQALAYFQERLRPTLPADPARVHRLIADLDDDDFNRREAAVRDLWRIGLCAEPALRTAMARTKSPEVRARAESLVERLAAQRRATSRAIRLLQEIGTPEARVLLLKLACGVPSDETTQAAKDALGGWDRRPSAKP
jgi:hypothetical protein